MADREHLPSIEFFNWTGLYTKGSNRVVNANQLRIAENTDLFSEYGAISKPPGSSRVLAAQYTETAVPQDMSWIGFYKHADLDGQILRHVLVAGGTILHRVESGGTLTALTGAGLSITEARTAGLFHTATMFDDFLFITNQDPDLIGNVDTLVKYDGAEIRRWGIVPPGGAETTIETFSSAASFTTDGGTATDETTTTQDGTAVNFDKDSVAQTNGSITKTLGGTFAISTAVADRGIVYCYIPRAELKNFATTDSVQVLVGSDADLLDNFYTFSFDTGSLIEGWNRLALDFSDSSLQTGSPVAASLQTIRFQVNSITAATTITGIRWDRFISLPDGTPTVAEGSAGSIFSDAAVYEWKVTFVGKEGQESNAGPDSATLTLTAARDELDLTDVPISADDQVMARKIYRTVNNGSIFLFVDTINDNTTTTFTDTIGDLSLGQTSPPLEGDLSDDNTIPPLGGIVKTWKRTCFMAGDPSAPQTVYFSEAGEGESWPILNAVTLDSKVTGIYETYSGLVVETETGKWLVTGENPDFRFDKIIVNIGCVGRRAAGETRLYGWAVDRDGLRLYDANNPVKVSEVIRDKFDDDFDKTNIELLQTVHSKARNAIALLAAGSDGKYDVNNYVYQYPQDDVAKGWWWELKLPSAINILDLEEIEDSDGTFKLYGGGDDGQIYYIFDPDSKDWDRASTGSDPITTKFQSNWLRLGDLGEDYEGKGVTGRLAPRLFEIVKSGDESTWTVTIETGHGPDQTTVTDSAVISMVFAANQNFLRYPAPRLTPGEFVRITVENAEASVRASILSAQLFMHIQPGQFVLEEGDMDGDDTT